MKQWKSALGALAGLTLMSAAFNFAAAEPLKIRQG
jgi:hypothetical protein